MFQPIKNINLREHPESPACAYLDTIFHQIEWCEDAFESFEAYQEASHKLREEKADRFEKLKDLYYAGDLQACYAIGCAYSCINSGVKRDPTLAHEFFQQAAEAGLPKAMASYAASCRRLNGFKDSPESIEWLKKGADAGDTGAMQSLALRYRAGDSPWIDYVKAEHWLKTAYAKGSRICAYHLGKLFEFATEDYDQAYIWYKRYYKHRSAGFVELARFLNRKDTKYYHPAEVLRLKIENVDHCTQSNRPIVCGEIAEHYLNGRGVAASKAEALRWLRTKLELLKPDTNLAKETHREIAGLEDCFI